MNFNKHSNLEGRHAFLSPSNYHWVNYDDAKLEQTLQNYGARFRGERLHALAKECIELGIKLPRTKATLNAYVNDAIGYRMTPEQVLYFSDNCFGTADAISFRNNHLRIHDLKTGQTPASWVQLELYQAIFCLEYKLDPEKIQSELRIYQFDEVHVLTPDPKDIRVLMDKIMDFDVKIEKMKGVGLGG